VSHRILVVDDEADITALVAYHLAKAGYRVSTATNGTEALKAAREERPDVVVLDLMLPGLSGYEVLAELRKRDETRDVGVILLTARRDEPDRIKGSRSPLPSWGSACRPCCGGWRRRRWPRAPHWWRDRSPLTGGPTGSRCTGRS